MGRGRGRVQILVLVLARVLGPGLGGGRDRDWVLGGVAACTIGPSLRNVTLYLQCYAYYACTMGPSLRKVTLYLLMLCILCLHDGPVPPESDAVELPLEGEHREGGERRLTQRGHAQGLEIGVGVRVGLEWG